MPDRRRTTDDLAHDASRSLRLLERAIRDYDSGDDLATALMAPHLRLLMSSSEELLGRIGDRLNRHPAVESGAPVSNDPAITIGVGALPSSTGHTHRTFKRFMRSRCLVVRDEDDLQVTFTWDELTRAAANKLELLHANETVDTLYDEIATYSVANDQQIIPLLLRQLSVLTVTIGEDLLADTAHPVELTHHGWETRGITLHAMEVRF